MRTILAPSILLCYLAFGGPSQPESFDRFQQGMATGQAVDYGREKLPTDFYMRLVGEIAGAKVVMNLHGSPGGIAGSYYYKGSWIGLEENESDLMETIVLSEQAGGKGSGEHYLLLDWNGSGFVGYWVNGTTEKKFPLRLRPMYPTGSIRMRYWTRSETVTQGSSEFRYTGRHLIPESETEHEKWLGNSFKQSAGFSPQVRWRDILLGSSRQALEKMMEGSAVDSKRGKSGAYASEKDSHVVFNGGFYLVTDNSSRTDAPGRYTEHRSVVSCYDLKGRKKMDIDEVLVPQAEISGVLKEAFKSQYGVKAHEGLNKVLYLNDLAPNGNFLFNEYGLAFKYSVGEIAPPGEGEIVVFLPYKKLGNLVRKSFLDRIAQLSVH